MGAAYAVIDVKVVAANVGGTQVNNLPIRVLGSC
jgi:hypothetical protein